MAGSLQVIFWDVQHGNAVYVRTPNDRHIVIDLGVGSWDDNNTIFSPLLHLRNTWGVNQLDYVVVTHPHRDHIDDILNFDLLSPKVFARPKHITNEEVMRGVRQQDKPKFDKYCEINNRYNTPISHDSLDNTSNPDNWGGLSITSFIPSTCDKNNFNNHSIVVVLEYLNTKIVIPGDNEKCSLDELMQNSAFKDAVKNSEILLAPHHGRESAYHPDFVTLVNPLLTIVSDGSICDTSANGRYGQKSRGWEVRKKSKYEFQKRYCLTTNSDGEIFVNIEPPNDAQYKSLLAVSIK